MAFAVLAAFIFVLALSGRNASRHTYWLVAMAAVGAAIWIYVS